MKYIWFHFMDFKSNKAVTLIIVLQFVFSMTCWQLAYSVTKDYLYLDHRLSSDYKYSVRVTASEVTNEEIDAVDSSAEGIRGFGVNYFHSTIEDGAMLDVGFYTKSTFTDFDFAYSGEKLDPEKNYGGADPAYVSSELSQEYKQGEYVVSDAGVFYICGYLKDKSLFYMSRNETSNLFLAAYDQGGFSNEVNFTGAAAFFTSPDEQIYETNISSIIKGTKSVTQPDWNEELKGAFSQVSGLLIISVWVMAIALIGLFSNNMLTFENNRRTHAVQLLMGAKKRRIIGLYTWRMFGSVLPAIPITAGIFKLLTAKFDKVSFSYEAVVFSVLVGAVVSVICVGIIAVRFAGRVVEGVRI